MRNSPTAEWKDVRCYGRESLKNETKATTGSAMPKSMTADAAEVNPLWQSLAMRSGVLQPKLAIGQAGDQYEREAERVAEVFQRAAYKLFVLEISIRERSTSVGVLYFCRTPKLMTACSMGRVEISWSHNWHKI
jgi:hypothetical protein